MDINQNVAAMTFTNEEGQQMTVEELVVKAHGRTVTVDATTECFFIKLELNGLKEVWRRSVHECEADGVGELRRTISGMFKGLEVPDLSNYVSLENYSRVEVALAIEKGLLTEIITTSEIRLRTNLFEAHKIEPNKFYKVSLDSDGDILLHVKDKTICHRLGSTEALNWLVDVDVEELDAFVQECRVERSSLLDQALESYKNRPSLAIGDHVKFNPKLENIHKPEGFCEGILVDIYQGYSVTQGSEDVLDDWNVYHPDFIMGFLRGKDTAMTLVPVDSKYLVHYASK